jgi:ABC-type branched-subunit amino acid transport system ATPase component
MKHGDHNLENILIAEHLKKSFGSIEAVRDVSFHVRKGEVLGIIGPNGAGKTTIFNLILGTHPQDVGNIFFMGENINRLKTFQRVNRGIARTFQFARYFSSLLIIEHIRIAILSAKKMRSKVRGDSETEAKQIAEAVRLESSVYKYPGELNIEELRKLELAMAVALQPTILLIDEMFAGLTRGESNEIIDIINNMVKEGSPSTVVVIDHNLSALSDIANRVIAIDLGIKIAEGSFAQVCSNEKVKKAYLGEYIQ